MRSKRVRKAPKSIEELEAEARQREEKQRAVEREKREGARERQERAALLQQAPRAPEREIALWTPQSGMQCCVEHIPLALWNEILEDFDIDELCLLANVNWFFYHVARHMLKKEAKERFGIEDPHVFTVRCFTKVKDSSKLKRKECFCFQIIV